MINRLTFEALIDDQFESYGIFADHANVLKERYKAEFDALYDGIKNCKNVDEAMWVKVNSEVFTGGIGSIVVDICEEEEIGIFA